MDRNIYLSKITLKEAKQKIEEAILEKKIIFKQESELIPVKEALDRITAEPAYARRSSLHYAAVAMDGIAVRSQDTSNATESSPVVLTHQRDFQYVNTGNPLPDGFDAVIKIEEVAPLEEGGKEQEQLQIYKSVFPGLNVRQVGEDIITSQLILSTNHKIRPMDIGALLAAGITEIVVRKKPRVAIIPTGEELRDPTEEELKPGEIVDFNSQMISNYIKQWGGQPVVYGVVRDLEEELKGTVISAVGKEDIILIIAGTSAGSKDFTARVLRESGEVLFHGITIMPGKPTIAGVVYNTPVIGLPGYPVSFLIAAWEFVLPLLFRFLEIPLPLNKQADALISRTIVSKVENEEFLRVKLAKMEEQLLAYPLSRGAGVISSLIEADGIVRIPAFSEGLTFKEKVTVDLLDDNIDYGNTIINIGSHDLLLDVLRNELQTAHPELRFASFHTGSMGGLMALKQGIAHMATSHLFDVESGEYNFPYIRRILDGHDLLVINMVYRQQGLIVAKGNPKNIKGIGDLLRGDIVYINRQKGSGTRVLLDYLLTEHKIDTEHIRGYQQEEFSHLMVASAVANQRADLGLGIYSAAEAFKLDFIPIIKERYDAIIPQRYYSSDRMQKLLAIIKTEHFKEQVAQLGGYDLNHCGKILTDGKTN